MFSALILAAETVETNEEYFHLVANKISRITLLRKQPSRGVVKKRRSENMQQIYRRIPMPKCDFNKATKQLY